MGRRPTSEGFAPPPRRMPSGGGPRRPQRFGWTDAFSLPGLHVDAVIGRKAAVEIVDTTGRDLHQWNLTPGTGPANALHGHQAFLRQVGDVETQFLQGHGVAKDVQFTLKKRQGGRLGVDEAQVVEDLAADDFLMTNSCGHNWLTPQNILSRLESGLGVL